MDTFRIAIYLRPWELDFFLRQVYMFIRSSYYIDRQKSNVIFDITLDVSNKLIDWSKSQLPREFFLKKMDYILNLLRKYYPVEFDMNESIQGCSDKRRVVSGKDHTFIIWLDPDIIFGQFVLPIMTFSALSLYDKEKFFILTPQIYKCWDCSWDIIVAERYKSVDFDKRDFFDTFSLEILPVLENINIHKIKPPKFGGGWFTLFTKSIFDQYPIPEELKSYGYEDFYYNCLGAFFDIPQFVIENCIVNELSKFLLEKSFFEKDFLCILKENYKKDISPEEYAIILNKKVDEYSKK